MIKEENIKVRNATFADAVPASELMERVGLIMPHGDEIIPQWKRLWHENPYYEVFDDEIHYGWIMEYENKMVGFFSRFPRLYYLDKKPFRLCIPTQLGIEKDFRKHKKWLCDQFFYHDPIPTRYATTAIKPTGILFESYGSIRVPSPNLDSIYMVPFRLDALILQKVSTKINNHFLSGLIKAISRVISYPWHWHYRFIKKSPFIAVVEVNDLTDDFDIFWNTYLQQSKGLVASRSVRSLKWFYQGGFRKLENKIFVYKKDGKVMGYAAILKEPVKDSEMSRYKIVDLLALTEEVKKELVLYLIRYCYDVGADVLEFHIPGLYTEKDIPVFHLTRKAPAWPYYYHSTVPEINTYFKNPELWTPSPYDGDTSFY